MMDYSIRETGENNGMSDIRYVSTSSSTVTFKSLTSDGLSATTIDATTVNVSGSLTVSGNTFNNFGPFNQIGETSITGNINCDGILSATTMMGNIAILGGNYLLDIYQSGSTTTLSDIGYTSLNWDAQAIIGSNYTHTPGTPDITINSSGTYKITYSVSINDSNNTRSISRTILSLDNVEIPRSGGYAYHRTTNAGEGTTSKTIIISLSQGDVIKVESITYVGGNNNLTTILNDSNITITKLNNV